MKIGVNEVYERIIDGWTHQHPPQRGRLGCIPIHLCDIRQLFKKVCHISDYSATRETESLTYPYPLDIKSTKKNKHFESNTKIRSYKCTMMMITTLFTTTAYEENDDKKHTHLERERGGGGLTLNVQGMTSNAAKLP